MLKAPRHLQVRIALIVVMLLQGALVAQRPDERTTRVFDNGNGGAVQNRPTGDTVVRLTRSTRIIAITTYHWNGGRGAAGGSISLRSESGEVFGPWQVRVSERVYWIANPDVTVPPGTYTIEDSSPSTWAHNAESRGAGMAWIEGYATKPSLAERKPVPPRDAPDVRQTTEASTRRPGDPTSAFAPADTTTVLFRGALDDRWVRHAAAGGNFDRDARFDNGQALVVNVPANNGNGNVGLLSPKPLVWLDDFGPTASSTVTFRFDPQRTTGLTVALSVPHYGGVPGNQPGAPGVLLTWARAADGSSSKLELHVNPHAAGKFRTVKLPAAAPREVSLTLRPCEIDWRIDGGEEIVDEFPEAQAGQGFHVYVFSAAPQWHAPVSMALQDVRLTRHRDPVKAQATQSVGKTTLFEGRADPAWEGFGVAGGVFQKFARYAGGALVVDVPKGNSWGKTGVMTVKPALHVERQTDIAPYRFTIRTDPERTAGVVAALATTRAPDMWSAGHLLWVSVIRMESGTYELYVQQTPYLSWARPLTARWNGQLVITLGSDGILVSVPGGPSIRTPVASIREAVDYYLQVIAHPRQASEPATLALQSVVRERVLPADLPAARRWEFLSPEEFKADEFLRDLQRDLVLDAIGGLPARKGIKR